MAGGYGLFRGINEGYQAYRQREQQIEEKNRRLAEDAYRKQAQERAQEQYEYGISRRPVQEQMQETQLEGAQTQNQMSAAQLEEFMANKDTRQKLVDMSLEQARLDLDNAGIQYDLNEVAREAALETQKYRQWKADFMEGGSIEDLVKKYNTDKDSKGNLIRRNDIKSVTGDEEKGWEVEFENGRVEKFDNRDQVATHLELMADPKFHQAYILNGMKMASDTYDAALDRANKNREFMFKQQQEWDKNTYKSTDRLYGKIKEGLVDFGEPGNAAVAQAIGSIVNQVGAASGYKYVHAAIVDDVARMANTMLDFNPNEARKRAEELYERMPEQQFPDGVKPEKGDEGYESAIKNIMADEAVQQIQELEKEIIPKYFGLRQDGDLVVRDGPQSAPPEGQKITDTGLERPGEGKKEEAEPEKGIQPPENRQSRKDVMPVDRDTQGATISLTPSSLVEKKRKEYGLGTKGIRPKKATAAQKSKIVKDFDTAFSGMTKSQQGAWYKEFGKYLDSGRQTLALEKMKGAAA